MIETNSIKRVDLIAQWHHEKNELLPIIEEVLGSGEYVGGSQVEKFEKNILKYTNTKFAISLNSGTDALTLALHLCGIKKNDEVITPPNSFIASSAAIVHIGAKPVFADVLEDQNIDPLEIEKKITKKTKAIMPVHLTGRVCKMDQILEIAKKYNILVIEDAAQSIGSKYDNKFSGSFGKVGCFSVHPLKNLNALGDGGFVTTDDEEFYHKVKSLRNHGILNRDKVETFGYVSRMDNLQAAVLNFRIKNLDKIIEKRRSLAEIYLSALNKDKIVLPTETENEFNTYHTFVIQYEKRDALRSYLAINGVETAIHYPIPIHLQPAANKFGYKYGDFKKTEIQANTILTLPIHQFLKDEEIFKITELINKFV